MFHGRVVVSAVGGKRWQIMVVKRAVPISTLELPGREQEKDARRDKRQRGVSRIRHGEVRRRNQTPTMASASDIFNVLGSAARGVGSPITSRAQQFELTCAATSVTAPQHRQATRRRRLVPFTVRSFKMKTDRKSRKEKPRTGEPRGQPPSLPGQRARFISQHAIIKYIFPGNHRQIFC